MARARSPEKRNAILQAAVEEIAAVGLGAATAKIAARAGVAAGTLFTYFATKEELLNELYVELKLELYTTMNVDFPHRGSMERRARHIWLSFLKWSIDSPAKRKVSIQLNLSDLVSKATRNRANADRGALDATLAELECGGAMRDLPAGFAAATMLAMQEATMDFIAREPLQREELMEQSFRVYWRAIR